jgi:5-methylcytosine-specific restriction endonuclease McrA
MVCGKPLYRRASDLAKVRHVACMAHRALAQSVSGVTEAQKRGLALGREKGTNHRTGYKHREESKRKAAATHLAYWAANPEKAKARGKRGERHYKWKGGASRLNRSVRQMTENRRWMDAVKERDGCCQRCGSTQRLEAHHLTELAVLIEQHGIKNRNDARCFAHVLWDLANGETLCESCHYREHGREKPEISRRKRRAMRIQELGGTA